MDKLKDIILDFIYDLKNKDKKAIGIAVGITVAVIAVVVAVVLLTNGSGKKNKETTTEKTTVVESTTPEPTTEPEPVVPKGMVRSQLTGQWIKKSKGIRRPISVMLNNIIDAVPQAGIEEAGVVYEAPVEGAICRFQAFFDDYDKLDKIGSVRSARTYFVYFSKQFDSIYLHFGQARYALDALESPEIDNLSGLSGVGNTVYYRTTDRVAPHNAYASAEGIKAGIEQMGYRKNLKKGYEGPYKFAEDDEEVNLEKGKPAIKIIPGYYVNKPWFEYNEKEKLYYRFQYDGKHIDQLTNHQLAYKNIIFQYCECESYYGTPYLNINTMGSGKGKYFTNGKYIDITWKKDSEFGQTFYYDKDGNQITMNQGKTWVCIITEEDRVEIHGKNN